jgi:hypothetical protein
MLSLALPWLSNECSTYVKDAAGVTGSWFYSLDCSEPLGVSVFSAARMCAIVDEWSMLPIE